MAFDLTRYQDPLTIQRVLHSAKTVAVLGLSSNHLRPSYFVAFYLKRHGYTMIPVNPKETEILGEKCYKSLADDSRAGGHRQRVPRAGCAAGNRRRKRSRLARSACGASSASSTRRARASRKRAA